MYVNNNQTLMVQENVLMIQLAYKCKKLNFAKVETILLLPKVKWQRAFIWNWMMYKFIINDFIANILLYA